ncbi:aminotransferase class III-fold pyridoxal phosphate-dependent enzyme [Bacillus sp. FJAT-45350]|uniref:aminotransferase class III-fold pyridoxal phosphate-dependent enzyme n=1 Tax=Bacillus sp. FJAT-45350 TaxID=2011014 RepID=UPI000BB7953B|nr:aminotransferase class III-fold pyridoxal phosphate-dependent enzyme [Bacillus sp. FJAT-45350]
MHNQSIIVNEDLVGNAKRMGDKLLKGLKYLEENHKITARAKAIGLMGGMEMLADPESNKPFDPSMYAALQGKGDVYHAMKEFFKKEEQEMKI